MEIFLNILLILVLGIAAFYAVLFLIKLWTGCNTEEAVAKLHNAVNGKAFTDLDCNIDFVNEVWENVRSIIGDKRYLQLKRLSTTKIDYPLLVFYIHCGAPCLEVTLPYNNSNDKKALEAVISNVLKAYLKQYGYSVFTFCEWKSRNDLNLPCLRIMYARTNKEEIALHDYSLRSINLLSSQDSNVTDDEDNEDLTDDDI